MFRFTIPNLAEKELENINIEIIVKDRSRIRKNLSLGQVRIGPNLVDNGHWDEMILHHGELVKKEHILREI